MEGRIVTEKERLNEQCREKHAEMYKNFMRQATIIATKKGYDVEDMDAIYVLFAEKLHWTPAQVRSMTLEELILIFDNIICGEGQMIPID